MLRHMVGAAVPILPSRTPATGSRIVAPVDTDYGMREFAVVDRSGNLIRVGSQSRP